ncbi:MAG: glycoside hydrolase family 95 protein [Marinilabiliaceae bacterium]|nr:glycoside hydrolase family 95 protein [Marinilabiliaceae bacterium]
MRFLNVALLVFLGVVALHGQKGGKLKMWYDKPATVWNEALPVGNGRLGAMIFGNPATEKIQLNEATFWSGGPSRNDNPNALKVLPQVRQLIFDGKHFEAEKLINQNMVTGLHGSKYQVIGDLNLAFNGHEGYTDYYRELDLERAVFTTTYRVNDVTYKREVFASQPDQVIVVRLSASRPKMLTFSAAFNGPLQKSSTALDGNMLEMTGLSGAHEGVAGQVKFNARAIVMAQGGITSIDADKVRVTNANEVVILISIATNFVDYLTLTADEVAKSKAYLDACGKKPYPKLLSNHQAAYQKYFKRSAFDLGTSAAASLPTDVRIKNFAQTHDPELVSMYYQFGRYLLISSSQPGGQPANLQGIWNGSTDPAWDSKYTININTEMNYWPAEKCNLSEMHEPLIQMVKELSQAGRQTARDMYGCQGWVAHHNTDIWRITGLVDGAYWGMWPTGGAWLTQHLWDKYLYSGDLTYLEAVYPVMKSASDFFKCVLVEEPIHKWLVVTPSVSPENNPAGRPSVCAGATMDNQIVFDLFTKTIKAATLLNRDADYIAELKAMRDRLPPMQIGQYGQLQEWMEDLDNPNDKHRHVSHLYGLFPSNQISPSTSPELFDAARTTLMHRGDVSTGWSMGWKVNFWARLLDGNHAMKLIKDQLTLVDPVNGGANGGTYPNFFDAHPPFQIDGNFGCAAGIAEMLMQCHDGAVHLLPALPDEWQDGEITGLRTVGGFEVSFSWKAGQVQLLVVKSSLGGNLRLRLPNHLKLANGKVLIAASGVNPNPFFEIPDIRRPLVSDKATLNEFTRKPSFEFDIETRPGQTLSCVAVR